MPRMITTQKFPRTIYRLSAMLIAMMGLSSCGSDSSGGSDDTVDSSSNREYLEAVDPIQAAASKSAEEISDPVVGQAHKVSVASLKLDERYWTAPKSNWRENERRIAGDVLRFGVSNILVTPVQAGENSFDPIERSLLTRLISDGVFNSTDTHVSNPTFVSQYLGRHRANFSVTELIDLGGVVRAENILILNANHNNNGSFEIGASLIRRSDGTELRAAVWSNLKYSDTNPPFVAINDILGDIVKFATAEEYRPAPDKNEFEPESFLFPASFDELVSISTRSSIQKVAYLQFIAALHPAGSFNEARNDLFERSLAELTRVSTDTNYYRYFKARALAYLDRRPAAVAALGPPSNTHERALLAALNGDLVALREEISGMGTTILDFMAQRDLLKVESDYRLQSESAALDQFLEESDYWAPFIYRALRDHEDWASYSAVTAKLGLEAIISSDKTAINDFMTAAQATGDQPSELDFVRLLWRHLDEIESGPLHTWGSDSSNNVVVSHADIYELAKSTIVANHWRAIEQDLSKRNLPERALQRVSEYESIFSDHPAITLQKARAQALAGRKLKGAENRSLNSKAVVESLNGFAWTGQLTADAVDVVRAYTIKLDTILEPRPSRTPEFTRQIARERRQNEWPKGAVWFRAITEAEAKSGALQQCVDYVWTSFACLKLLIELAEQAPNASDSIRKELLRKYAHRYVGSPQRSELEIDAAKISDDAGSEIRKLRRLIDSGAKDWSVFYALGRAHKRQNQYEAAQKVFLSYPGFGGSGSDTAVQISNYANDAGSMLYWVGQHELAIPLLNISASTRTGSSAEFSSGARVALIAGDLESAAEWSAARVRRYGSKYAIRDLQQLLHARGESKSAWSIFDQVQGKSADAQMWSGALVGHRIEGATSEDIASWLEASFTRHHANMRTSPSSPQIMLGGRYLLLSGIMDRTPGPELGAAISGYPVVQTTRLVRHRRPTPIRPGSTIMVNSYLRQGAHEIHHDDLVSAPPEDLSVKSGDAIDSRYELLAKAMSAFLNGDHQRAFEIFNQTAYYYMLDEYLSYYAFSAAMVGKSSHLPTALGAREPDLENIRLKESATLSELGYRYDEDLTYAVLASFGGRHDEALHYLKKALNNRPYLDERTVYPLYQVADLAERLYKHSGKEIYRDFAVNLARRHTVILPMYSWAYFFVAMYGDTEKERLTAAANGLHLDPLSHRGTLLPKKLLELAKLELEKSGPPYLQASVGQPDLET